MGRTVGPQEKNLSTATPRRARRTQGFGRDEAFAHLLVSGPRARYDVVPPLYRSMMLLLSWELTAVIGGKVEKGMRRKRAGQSTTRPCSFRRTKHSRLIGRSSHGITVGVQGPMTLEVETVEQTALALTSAVPRRHSTSPP